MVLLVAFFLVGSIVCGCIIRRSAVKMACMGYGVAMTSSGFILVFATFMFSVSQDAAVYSLCFACGLQNGIMSSYTGSVVRTTHVTGIATDIGLITGRHIMSFFRRRLCKRLTFADEEPGEERKLLLLLLLLLSFLAGVAAGSGLARVWGEFSLLVPAIIALLSGAGYMLWTHFREDIQEEVVSAMMSPRSDTTPTLEADAKLDKSPKSLTDAFGLQAEKKEAAGP